jgi:hypothetical protein
MRPEDLQLLLTRFKPGFLELSENEGCALRIAALSGPKWKITGRGACALFRRRLLMTRWTGVESARLRVGAGEVRENDHREKEEIPWIHGQNIC